MRPVIQHLACVMDGNRRWAKKNNVSLKTGVLEGLARVQTVVDFCLEHTISYVSLYAFSLENLQRSALERACIFSTLTEHGLEYGKTMAEKQVRVKFVGERSVLDQDTLDVINAIETMTKNCTKLSLQFLFCYGGRQEILAAVNTILDDYRAGIRSTPTITHDIFKQYLWMGDIPDPEMVIRTGFASRLSNFLPYQSVYSELYFPQILWPDISQELLEQALHYFNACKRNFGV